MSNEMSVSASTKIPVSEITTFQAPTVARDADLDPIAHELVIAPSKGWIGVNWAELIHYRELLAFLVWRDVKVRYKQAVLGILWAVLEPVMNMILFTAIFARGARFDLHLPSDLPFAIFVFNGLIVWKLFQTSLSVGGMSLLNSQNLLTKIYFPRLFVPTATVGSALFDMALQFGVFAAVMLFYGYVPSWQIVFLPLLILLTVMMSLGVAFLLSALTVTYRDFRFVIPMMTQLWMWISFVPMPIPESIRDSAKWQPFLALNPMYSIVAAFRKCVTGHSEEVGFRPAYLAISIVIAITVFLVGIFYFRKTEKRFADIA